MSVQVRASEIDNLELRCRLVVRGKEGFSKSNCAKALLTLAAACRAASVALGEEEDDVAACADWEAADVVKAST